MSTVFKSLVLGFGLVAGVAFGAQAQAVTQAPVVPGPSIANLPPEGPRASSLNNIPNNPHPQVAPSGALIGPDPGKGWYPQEKQSQDVQPSPQYIGPKPN